MDNDFKKIMEKIYEEEKKLNPEEYLKLNNICYINHIRKNGISFIKKNIKEKNFQKEITNLKKKNIKQQIKEEKEKIKKSTSKEMKKILNEEILRLEKEIDEIDFSKIIMKFKKFYNDAIYEITEEEYVYDKILDLFYQEYKKNVETECDMNEKNNMLAQTYKYINDDEQYEKYKLLKINDYRKLVKVRFFHLTDTRIEDENYIFLDKSLSEKICEKLKDLKDKGYIKELSLRPNYCFKISKIIPSAEEIEFGKVFKFANLNQVLPTKLYSIENEDTLWINIEKKNITFEEILKDFEIIKNDIIRTQVIHCEYFEEKGKFYISHMDHEYIFYSLEEYVKRLSDIKQKGNILKRIKTFKIDNSKIPFILEDGMNVLLFFLNEYFKSEKLLLEYFQKIN